MKTEATFSLDFSYETLKNICAVPSKKSFHFLATCAISRLIKILINSLHTKKCFGSVACFLSRVSRHLNLVITTFDAVFYLLCHFWTLALARLVFSAPTEASVLCELVHYWFSIIWKFSFVLKSYKSLIYFFSQKSMQTFFL